MSKGKFVQRLFVSTVNEAVKIGSLRLENRIPPQPRVYEEKTHEDIINQEVKSGFSRYLPEDSICPESALVRGRQ